MCDKANKNLSRFFCVCVSPSSFPVAGRRGRGQGEVGRERAWAYFTSHATLPLKLHLQLRKFVREKWSFCFPCSKHVIKMLI